MRFRVPQGTACSAADYLSSRWNSCRVAASVPVIYITGYQHFVPPALKFPSPSSFILHPFPRVARRGDTIRATGSGPKWRSHEVPPAHGGTKWNHGNDCNFEFYSPERAMFTNVGDLLWGVKLMAGFPMLCSRERLGHGVFSRSRCSAARDRTVTATRSKVFKIDQPRSKFFTERNR